MPAVCKLITLSYQDSVMAILLRVTNYDKLDDVSTLLIELTQGGG
jgi:hypothetical protein